MKNILKALSILLVCSLLAACGGGSGGGGSNGSNGSSSTPAPDENANGIWSGTSSVNGLVSETLGLFNDGDFVAINFDFDEFYKGTYSIDGTDITASANGYSLGGPFGGTGTLSGVISSEGTLKATTNSSLGTTADLDLVYETQFSERTISLADLSGSWVGSVPGLSFNISIDNSGNLTAIGSDGCNVSGALNIPNSGRNMIAADITISGNFCTANGNYSGLGVLLDDDAVNDALVFGYANNQYGFAYAAFRN
ncbi:hypothetical protein N8087_05485 [Porticoccaceae bacterium]|nr:hypothetical protein [Porticoccaceae bacterium]